ncbi:(d)CMP kinase [Aestuariivivens sediminis]|uniref:(d)CMP kinase n=1 Tax=Aestuariivivens sediminis TaxID=2913557 RepID=UPI001F592557|nr:(d)CMP kinase [Aestuariivivens sediminis]
MDKITIAIDGFSSTGKSTVAKQLAKHLGYVYVDSGAMYRAVTYFAMEQGFIDKNHFDVSGLISKLNEVKISLKYNDELGYSEMFLNGDNVEKKIRTLEVSENVSLVAAVPEIRAQLVKHQKNMGAEKGVVMDGRDIGTVVFPNAELKLFMTASPETRAIRRYNELKQRGDDVTYEAVLKNIQDRDFIDSNRKDSPLVKASDAIEIDNSHMSKEQQFEIILNLVNKTLKSS